MKHQHKIILFILILFLLPLFSGCFVSKTAYERKALIARNLNRRLDKKKQEKKAIEKEFEASKKENTELKKILSDHEKTIMQLQNNINEQEKTTESLQLNLDKEKEDKFKELAGMQSFQTDEINKLRDQNIVLIDAKQEFLQKESAYEITIKNLRIQTDDLSIENQNMMTIKLAQMKEIRDLMKRNDLLEKEIKKKIVRLEKIERLKKKFTKLLAGEMKSKKVVIRHTKEKLIVRIFTNALFDSKKIASLTKEGKKIIKRISPIMKSLKGRKIVIEGHTDSRGISAKIKEQFPSNWHLSSERAISVVRYLYEALKIDPAALSAAGYSSHQPLDSNETEKGRTKNRRIEIVISGF